MCTLYSSIQRVKKDTVDPLSEDTWSDLGNVYPLSEYTGSDK
jgi:hypothetical protein